MPIPYDPPPSAPDRAPEHPVPTNGPNAPPDGPREGARPAPATSRDTAPRRETRMSADGQLAAYRAAYEG